MERATSSSPGLLHLHLHVHLHLHLIILLCLLTLCVATKANSCTIPWTGKWLHDERQIHLKQHHWARLGTCVRQFGDYYVFRTNSTNTICYRCVLALSPHVNVLRYKQTLCLDISTADDISKELCRDSIRGDAPFETLFKANPILEPCPLEAPLNFTYVTTHGECTSRISSIQHCADEQKLSLQYEACPELPNSESLGYQLECLGHWRHFEAKMMAVRLRRRGTIVTHRCMILDGGSLGISADATCKELASIRSAHRKLTLKPDHQIEPACEFPAQLRSAAWIATSSNLRSTFHEGVWQVFQAQSRVTKSSCVSDLNAQQSALRSESPLFYRTHVTQACNIGFQCVQISFLSEDAVSIATGAITANELEKCNDGMVVVHRETLVRRGARTECPGRGKYSVRVCDLPAVEVGCSEPASLLMRGRCSASEEPLLFECLAAWKNGDNEYAVTKVHGELQCLRISSSSLRLYPILSCDATTLATTPPATDILIDSHSSCDGWFISSFLSSSSSMWSLSLSILVLLLLRVL